MKSIAEILRPESLRLPPSPPVEDIEWYEYTDSVGDPALRIIIVLRDDISDEERNWTHIKPIRERIASELRENDIFLFPYTRFVTGKELSSERAA